MHVIRLLGAVLVLFVSFGLANPGLLFDESLYTYHVLENIQQTPYCAYACYFNKKYKEKWGPHCKSVAGKEAGACYCRANAYQYIVDQCYARKCKRNQRIKV